MRTATAHYHTLYLCAFERGNGGACVGSKRLSGGVNRGDASLEEQRGLLAALYPDARLVSPLERIPRGSTARGVTLWLSPSQDGSAGRMGGAFHQWAVILPATAPAAETVNHQGARNR